MSAVDDILRDLPVDRLAARLGADPDDVHDAAYAAIPALLGGLQANAADPRGADSLLGALDQHTGDVDVVDLDGDGIADGEKAAAHIFGAQQDQVVQRLGGSSGVGGDLMSRLLPMLVPLVLSYVARQVGGGRAPSAAASGGGLGSILNQVIAGAAQGTRASGRKSATPDVGSILGTVLGGLLGGGRR